MVKKKVFFQMVLSKELKKVVSKQLSLQTGKKIYYFLMEQESKNFPMARLERLILMARMKHLIEDSEGNKPYIVTNNLVDCNIIFYID